MTSDELIKLIDYYNRSQSSYLSKIVPICAVVVALTSLIASWRWLVRDRETRLRQELYGLWDGLVSDFIQHPDFLDKHVTSKYPNLKDAEARFAYDALCFRAWGLFRRIATSRLKTVPEYNAIAQWIATNLRIWIEFNPVFFPEAQFWQYLQQLIDRPIVDFQLAPLPRMANTKPEDDGTVAERYDLDIDWDTIAKNYHSCILGPFAPTMVDSSHGSMRNLLIDELNKIPENDFGKMSVLDLGCGPGNLIDALRYKPRELVGVDLSESALEIASKKAHAKGFPFEKIKGDIRSLRFDKTYDIVISVNSILPPTRSDIKLMLRTAREAVDFHGMFYAILPSFDTTQFLRELWYKHFIKTYGDVEHAKRCVEQIDRAKRVNRQECLYADDGRYQQAYHTPETIRREFLESQLRITQGPQKVRYPWELTRPFDYGYFPEADEEIWDWYVVAQRG